MSARRVVNLSQQQQLQQQLCAVVVVAVAVAVTTTNQSGAFCPATFAAADTAAGVDAGLLSS